MKQPVLVTENDVLVNLARSIPFTEEVVQLGVTHEYAGAWHDIPVSEIDGRKVGLLHLGPGRHVEFSEWQHLLVKGAIVLIEECAPDSPAYTYASDLAAHGYLSGLSEARFWKGLGVATYLG